MTRFLRALAGLMMASALVACGGGGGSAGGNPDDPQNPDNPGGAEVATLIYTLSKASINNSGGDESALTITALDARNNPVANVPVTVSVDSGVYTPSTTTTAANGQVSGTIGIGADKSNRDITATITADSEKSTAVVEVVGSAIAVTPVPATPAPGQSVRLDMKVTDSSGAGVSGVRVALGGTLGFTGTTARTDSSGNVSATLAAAPATAGSYTIDATALGVATSRTVQVIAGGGGGIPAVTQTISSASLSIVPNTIAPNTSGSTTNRAGLRAKFLNASNQAIQNVRVKFVIDAPALGSGEAISNTGTVYSDVNGEAIADYIPGTRSSPTNGVVIRACYGKTDADVATCNSSTANSVTKTLTVASQPLSITLGDNNLLARGNSSLTYIKTFDVAVADAAGNAVANAAISASVDITQYGKGDFDDPRLWCANEDTNRNGSLDSGEDKNFNGQIDPRKADVILSFLGTNVTGSNGRMAIQVEYPQNVATWLKYTVKVTTNAAGSEGTVSKNYVTTFIEGDEKNGSFLDAPYGAIPDCTNPN